MTSSSPKTIVFLQRSPAAAGAQTCLMRLMTAARDAGDRPFLVVGSEGYLTREAQRRELGFLILPWPKQRSMAARLHFDHLIFAKMALRLRERLGQVDVLVGNDHTEGPAVLKLNRGLGVLTFVFLRTPGMSVEQFVKYKCDHMSGVFAIGPELAKTARSVLGDKSRILSTHDGLEADEFCSEIVNSPKLSKILVIGSPAKHKGWILFSQALQAEADLLTDLQEIAFTGIPKHAEQQEIRKNVPSAIRVLFHERVDQPRILLQNYDLVVNPSTRESFGMAAMEAVAAGKLVLSTRTGVAEEILADRRFLALPADVSSLANSMAGLAASWPPNPDPRPEQIARLSARYNVSRVYEQLSAEYDAIA